MIIVVGNPRHHTSLVMQSLAKMGLRVVGDFIPSEINARGHGECWESHHGVRASQYGPQVTMKVFTGPFLFKSTISTEDKVIFCLRSPAGVSASQGKAFIWNPESSLRRFNYWRLVTQFRNWMMDAPNRVLVVDTDALVANPAEGMLAVGDFLGVKDIAGAIANVTPELTRPAPDEIEDDALAIYQEMRALCTATT